MDTDKQNIFNFLKLYQPFSPLPNFVITSLVKNLKTENYEKGIVIFNEGELAKEFIFVIRSGAIALTKTEHNSQKENLIDLCGEGDVFGARILLTSGKYILNAIVKEDVRLYCIPLKDARFLIEKYTQVSIFFARQFAFQLPEISRNTANQNESHLALKNNIEATDFKLINGVKPVVSVSPNCKIDEAAKIMNNKGIGALLITDDNYFPRGIITDADLRRKVVAKDMLPSEVSVNEIMSTPVICITKNIQISSLIVLMAEKNIRHFCVTENGTQASKVIGIISERDIVAAQGNNPAVIIRKIHQSNDIAALKILRDTTDELIKSYLEQETALRFVLEIITKINDAIIEKIIGLALIILEKKGLGQAPVNFCWLSLGSEGRKEQLLRTDQDNALIYDNSPKGEETVVNNFFIELGTVVTNLLAEVGFEKCPADIMASNKHWCKSLDDWQDQLAKWISTPTPEALLKCLTFFDFRPVYGAEHLAKKLQENIFSLLEKDTLFLSYAAVNALANPAPLSFFRNFVVEKGGDFSDFFDIKARALMPLSDAARVLAYHKKIALFGSTLDRFNTLAQVDENNRVIYKEAIMAFEILLRTRALNGLNQQNNGRYISIEKLNKLQRQTLKNIFAITDKIQQIVQVRLQTDYIR
ncbi:MAG: DUF294 nucleotidyltransferase-like domain-containing protein [Bacteroidota bacterium]